MPILLTVPADAAEVCTPHNVHVDSYLQDFNLSLFVCAF